MKTKLILLITTLISSLAFGHEGVERGPNGGRILEFSDNETMHGEIAVKDGKFHIALLDKDMKAVVMSEQSLTAVTGDRAAPAKLEVTKDAKGFTLPLVKAGEWLILRYKETPSAKAITARLEYNTATCEECKAEEWLCKCKPEAEKK
ncbi:MAG: hypothetical protein IPK32_00810 [Verrucomicrobiaceae bacterium]|nr:hypothetical protein [Verrucomicrobiaceae bacterium]